MVVHATEDKCNKIYGSRLGETTMSKGKPQTFAKYPLTVQPYNDKDHGLLIYTPLFNLFYSNFFSIMWHGQKSSFLTCNVYRAFVHTETFTKR